MAADSTALQPAIEGKTRFLTLGHLDGRTRAARRARDLIAGIEEDLGGSDRLTEAERQLVQRAGILGAVIEHAESRFLAGGGEVELADYLAACNSQRRILTTLGLQRRSRDVVLDPLAYARAKGQPDLQAGGRSVRPDAPEQAG